MLHADPGFPLTLGRLRGFDVRFHLYTVPGQVFYRASRSLILRGVDGIVFVADSQREPVSESAGKGEVKP